MPTRIQPEPEATTTGEALPRRARFSLRGPRMKKGGANTVLLALVFLFGSALLAALGWRFPDEASRWIANQDEIRRLQDDNANLRKLRDERRDRLKRFNENYQEQQLELQRQYNLYPKDTKIFVLPPAEPSSKQGDPSSAVPAGPTENRNPVAP